jgi:AraC-like DNA-binding protein
MIVLEFGDAVDVIDVDKRVQRMAPPAVLVGPQTHRTFEMKLKGTLRQFVIMFEPDGLRRLFAVPTQELTDKAYDAHSVLGRFIPRLRQTLGDAQSFEERVLLVNNAMIRQALRCRSANVVSQAADWVVRTNGRVSIPTLANTAGLSERHFARRFIAQMGIRPKLFARVVRFQAALETKALHGWKSWTEVAHDFDYYDQMHMVHDFQQLAGETPTAMLAQLEAVFVNEIRKVRMGTVQSGDLSATRLIL